MKVIGLTGGVACGKTTVAERIASKGIPVIDTDEAAHRLLERDPSVQKQVQAAFGTTDRKRLREIVFNHDEKRTRLEKILHPEIQKDVQKQLHALRKKTPTPEAAVVVIPLLYETGAETRVDRVVAVVSRRETQLARLISRDGITRELAEKMIDAQMPNDEKAKRANYTIQNDADVATLLETADRTIGKFLEGPVS